MSGKLTKTLSPFLCFLLIFQQAGFAQLAGELDLSGHFSRLASSFAQPVIFRPLHLRYLSYDPAANNFSLLLDKGDLKQPKTRELEASTKELLSYFFIGISLPNSAFWVNLRPDSPDNIIDPELAETDVGKILLEADLQLKKDTANFTSPQTPEGEDYWDKLYKKAEELYGSENITIPTLTRPWIVPDEIIIRESPDNAYIYKATLKVMLEQDYLKDSSTYSFPDQRSKALNEYSSQLIRETIIPKLTKEINSSKRYAPLRQVYYSLILAQWFKQKFYGQSGVYSYLIDRHRLDGLTSTTPWSKTTYFNSYRASFRQGEYNIKEPRSTLYGQSIRSYMSGGIAFASVSSTMSAGIVHGAHRDFEGAPYIIPLNTHGGPLSRPFEIKINTVLSADEQLPVAVSSSSLENGNKGMYDYLSPQDFLGLIAASQRQYDAILVEMLQNYIANPETSPEEAGKINVVKLNGLLLALNDAQHRIALGHLRDSLEQYLLLVSTIRKEKRIEITSYVPREQISLVRDVLMWFPKQLTQHIRVPIQLSFEELDEDIGGLAGQQTVRGVRINNLHRLSRQIIYHELAHKFSLSSNHQKEPLFPMKAWKEVAKAAGFYGAFIPDSVSVTGYRLAPLNELPDELAEWRAINYGKWVYQEGNGSLSCYVSRKDYKKLKNDLRYVVGRRKVNLKVYNYGEYWKTTPKESVAEAGAAYIIDSRSALSRGDGFGKVARILRNTLFVTQFPDGNYYRYSFTSEGRKTYAGLSDQELEERVNRYGYPVSLKPADITRQFCGNMRVKLQKVDLEAGQSSRVGVGEGTDGLLGWEIKVGQSVVLKDGNGIRIFNTSPVKKIEIVNEQMLRIYTQTSVYNVILVNGISILKKFAAGVRVRMQKAQIISGKESAIGRGEVFSGFLKGEVKQGAPIVLTNAQGIRISNTSDVAKVIIISGRALRVYTQTSIYTVELLQALAGSPTEQAEAPGGPALRMAPALRNIGDYVFGRDNKKVTLVDKIPGTGKQSRLEELANKKLALDSSGGFFSVVTIEGVNDELGQPKHFVVKSEINLSMLTRHPNTRAFYALRDNGKRSLFARDLLSLMLADPAFNGYKVRIPEVRRIVLRDSDEVLIATEYIEGADTLKSRLLGDKEDSREIAQKENSALLDMFFGLLLYQDDREYLVKNNALIPFDFDTVLAPLFYLIANKGMAHSYNTYGYRLRGKKEEYVEAAGKIRDFMLAQREAVRAIIEKYWPETAAPEDIMLGNNRLLSVSGDMVEAFLEAQAKRIATSAERWTRQKDVRFWDDRPIADLSYVEDKLSAGSPTVLQTGSKWFEINAGQKLDAKGGVDMRALPKYTKVERIAGQATEGGVRPVARAGVVFDKEWQEIERMVNSGIAPSCERIREYLLSLKDPNSQINKVLACIADILRQEEERACCTESPLKEILALLESGKPADELRLALMKVEVLAQEPQLIGQ